MVSAAASVLTVEEIERRVRLIKDGTPKGLEANRRHNRHILRLADIAAYIGIPKADLYTKGAARLHQRELSAVLKLLEAGELAKVQRGDGTWQLMRRDPALAQVAAASSEASAAPASKVHTMTHELAAANPRLRLTRVNGS